MEIITNKHTIEKLLKKFKEFKNLNKECKLKFMRDYYISAENFDKVEKTFTKEHKCIICKEKFKWNDKYNELCCNHTNKFHVIRSEKKRKQKKKQKFLSIMFEFETALLASDIKYIELHYDTDNLLNIKPHFKIDVYHSAFFLN